MMLKLQKRLAADVMNCSPKKIVFDQSRLEDIKEAITKTDIRMLIGEGAITVMNSRGVSRSRARELMRRKSRGLRRGPGSRKGRSTARNPAKKAWIRKIRSQRKFLQNILLRDVVSHESYKDLYKKASGGFFRSVKHIQIFMAERNLAIKRQQAEEPTQSQARQSKARKKKA